MSNFVFYDFETSSSNKQWGQIIEIGAILTDDQLNELDRFDSRCRLSPGIIPEAMSLIVSNTTPKKLKETNLTHYEMIKQFVEKLKSWGKVTYIGWNNIEFDQIFLRNTLFQNLHYPFASTTNGNKEGDLLNLARAANLYYPKTLNNATNKKGNLEYKLDTMAPLNGIEHKAHTAIGDCGATLEIARIIKKKAPSVWDSSLLTSNKDESLKLIKNEKFFCANEFYYGKVVPFVQTFVCQHPVYQWPKTFDLKHDPNIYMNMPIKVLKEELKKSPKVLRTCRHNKHPIVMNPSYIENFEEYKIIGINKLNERADIVRKNQKFAEKVEVILRDEAQEKEETKSQEDLCEEETLYNFSPQQKEDNKILSGFHEVDWDKRLSYLQKFKDKRFHYFGKKLLYQEKPDLLPKEDYDDIHGTITKRVLSTNDEKKWNTIPRTFKEIDDLRAKFEKSKEEGKLKMLEEINAYVEELEKTYSSA
jgi:exodeoxyribonuclease-1